MPSLLPLCVLLLTLLPISLANTRDARIRAHPQLFQFPYIGIGDRDHSFRHPFTPSISGDPVDGWLQLGTATVARSPHGRDVLRLTSPAQANQGVFYNTIKTESNNFNGYIDIQMDTSHDSHEAADGMGMFFVRDIPTLGSAMGMNDRFVGLGIIIDTFSNSRTRKVPYLYAFVSDGTKTWNPDHDGGDHELARGCQLEMNTKIRVYIQYVDGELHVAVAMNPRNAQRWHTCFKVSNVHLPFSNGGYFAFAGETGHFFALHEVHDAVFVDEANFERSHSSGSDYGRSSEYTRRDTHEAPSMDRNVKKDRQPDYKTNPDANVRVHRGESAHDSLSGSLDLQVYEVFNSLSSQLKKLGDKEADDTRLRLDGVREITSHLIKEMDKQQSQMKGLIETLRHLKASAGDLSYVSDKFSAQLKGFHSSLRTLREKTEDMADSHDDMHADIIDHHHVIKEGTGNGTMIMFFVLQILLAVGVFLVTKLNTNAKKMGRMV